jgi:uncharacterized protein (TIGR02147 family)
MINIFEYTDYRKYLEDYYQEKKKQNPKYSYQVIAQKAGFNNRGFVYNIIKGIKSCSKSHCFRLSQALSHTTFEAEYFENMVSFNRAENLKEKNFFFDKLNQIRAATANISKAQIIKQNQYELYATWYHSAIRSLIGMYKFDGDYDWLSKMVFPLITTKQAKQSVDLLLSLGLIYQDENGFFNITEKSITTGNDISGFAISNFHLECTNLAKNAIHNLPRDQRHATGLTLGISRKTYDEICKEIEEFQQRLMMIANQDEKANQVFQINFHFFPFSKSDSERTRD